MDWKKYLEIALVTTVTVAIIWRVSALRSVVAGQ